MAAKRFVHHFVPHNHVETGDRHRGHALENSALFAYLLIFFITVSGFWLVRVKAPQILGSASYGAEQIISLTNIKRAENGLAPLSSSSKLANAARAKSDDMLSKNYWAHFSPQGTTPWSFITAAGYKYIFAGENLARDFNDATSVVNAWMASPSHKQNILDKNFKEIGVAVSDGRLQGREGVLVVQLFGASTSQAPVRSVSSTTVENKSQGSPSPTPVTAGAGVIQDQDKQETSNEAEQIILEEEPQLVSQSSATVLASRQFSISKIVSLILVSFIFLLFVLEVAVAGKKRDLQIKSSTFAHLGLLALILFTLWYAVSGAVI